MANGIQGPSENLMIRKNVIPHVDKDDLFWKHIKDEKDFLWNLSIRFRLFEY